MQGLVLYTDGGCRPNPGQGGWGLHGYLYLKEKPKKGAGIPDHILTSDGYLSKIKANGGAVKFEEVTPLHYVEGFGAFGLPVTNNVAELTAAIRGLQYSIDYDIGSVRVYTDSEYVIKGIDGWKGAESWVEGWAKNGWTKGDGSEIANVRLWRELSELRDQLLMRNVDVSFEWVKGHTDKLKDQDDVLGNIRADKLATIGVLTAKRLMEERNEIGNKPVEGFWTYTPDRHPFINHRRLYFNTSAALNAPGEYYLGEHGKEDDMLGKRISDGAYAVIKLKEPDPVLELVRNYQIELANGVDTIVSALLDRIYRAETHKEISEFGTRALEQPNAFRMDLLALDGEPVTHEHRPPKLAMRAVEAIGDLTDRLDRYLTQHPSIVLTDLTPILYETTVKASKKGETSSSMKLKPEYNVGFAKLEVDANYRVGDEDVAIAPVILTLGIDMPDRNALKRLESMNPKVTLITWNESPTIFRYATVIETGDDKGIWAGVYSNLRVIPQ